MVKSGDYMFIGQYAHNLDSKGRIIIPSKVRSELGERFILTRGIDKCLYIYPLGEWKIMEEKMKKLPLTNKKARQFSRFFLSGAQEIELDKMGRMNIPKHLTEYAELLKECLIVGVSERLEVWNTQKFEEEFDSFADDFESLAEEMMEFDI